ncbi:autotransporter-associated beta strand repeat-containing protein [Verrucomicrobiota bacterium sgz303538]
MKSPRILSRSIATLTSFSAAKSTRITRKEARARIFAVGLGLSLAGLSLPASAQSNQTWNQASADNNWNLTSLNWDAGAAWTQNNNAIFAVAGEPVLVNSDPIIFNDLTFNVSGFTIGAGSGSLVLANDRASTITVTTGIATIAETMADSANGASSLTLLGGGTLVLSGLNTYTGNTTIGAGTLSVSVLNNSGTAGNVGAGSTINIGAGTTAGALTYTGTGETTNRILDLAGSTGGVTITQSGASGTLKFTSNLTASGAGIKTLTLSGSTSGIGELAGAIVDNSATNTTALTKAGTGTWVLSGNNTYSGVTTLSGGVLSVTHGNALGSTTGGTVQSGASELRISGGIAMAAEPISINGGGINNAGALRNFADNNTYSGTLTLAAQSRIVSDSGTLTMNGANAVTAAAGTNQNLILSGAGNFNIAGNITLGTGFVFKDALVGGGTGTLTLGGNNTYTGATTVGAGTLKLDYTTNNTSKLSDTAALVLGTLTGSVPGIGTLNTGGTVELAGGSHGEIVSGTTLTAYTPASTITRSSGTSVLHLNTVTPGTGTGLIFTAPGIATTDNFPTNGILGFWARMNVGGVSSWATSAGADDSPIVAFTDYTNVNRLGGTIPNTETSNVRIVNGGTSGNITLGGGARTQIYSFQVDATGPATIAMGAATDVLNVGDEFGGGIWQTANAGGLTIGSAVGSGVLTTGAFENGLAANLQLINDSVTNKLVVNSTVTDNGIDPVSVTKSGAGTVVLNGNNTFTGLLNVAGGGTLILTGNNATRPTGVNGMTTVAGTLQVQANEGNTSGGISTVLGSEQTANQPFILNNGGTLQLRSDSSVTFAGGNNFGGLGTAAVTIDVNQLTSAGTNNTLTFAPKGFNVSNTTINVTGGNGYRLVLGTITNVTGANSNNMTLNPTTGALTVGGYTGTTAFTSTLNLSGTSSGNVVSGPVTNTTNATSAAISVTKLGSSSWDLQGVNTYTGTTIVREGTLTFSGNRTATSGGITVGDTAGLNATLNISNGNFSMGSGTFVVAGQANSSTVNQTGGSLTMGGTQMIVGNGAAGSVGTYNLSGGTLTGAASTTRGVILGTNSDTTGIFNLSGTGNLALGLSNVQIGRSDSAATNSTGIFNQTGGTAAVGTLTIGGGAGAPNDGTRGTLNLTGGTFTATNFTLFGAANNSTANITIGGTAQVTLPAFPTARGLNATTNITFDGGTLTPAAASTSYIGGLTNAFLTANGAKFDVPLGRDITITQVLSNAAGQTGTLTKLGVGTLTLTGANTYTGATNVNAGTLLVNGSLAAGPVTVGAAGTFGGTATVAGAVTTVSGSRIVPGGSTVAGTLTVGGITFASGAAVDFDLGASSDLINVTNPGGLVLNGGVFSIFNTGGLTPFSTNGTYSLIDYAGTFTGSLSNISIGNAQAGKLYTINNDATNTVISLTIGDATVTEWNTGSGSWGVAGNWTGGVPNAPGAVAKFGTVPQSPTTVTVDGAKTVGGIVFDNTNSYTLAGGAADTITLSNGIATAGITVTNGNHVISAPVALATDTLASTAAGTTLRLSGNVSGAKTFSAAGAGTTILSGSNSYGATVVSSGTLQIGDNGTTGTLGAGDVSVSGGATLAFNRSDSFTVANNIGGIAGQVTKLGTGTLTLTGTNSFGTVSGGLGLNSGTVKVGSATALPAGVRLAFAGGTLDLNENNATVSSLTGSSGTITDTSLTAGTSTLTYDSTNASTYGGVIANGAARSVALSKSGTGALTLTGNNTFTGGVTITGGAVIAAGPVGNTPIPGNVTLGNGTSSVFLIAGLAANPNQFGANTVVTFANGGLDAKLELRGSTTTLAGIDSSPTTTLSIIQNDEVGSPGYTAAPGVATLVLNTTTDHSFTGLIRNQAGGGLNIVKEGVGSQEIRNVAAAADSFGTATINAGKLTFNFAGTNNTLGASTSVIVNQNGTLGLDGIWNMNRPISGSGTVLKQGTGTVTISGVNTNTGNVTVGEGTLLAAGTAGTSVLSGTVVMGTGAANSIFLAMGAENQFAPGTAIKFNNGPGKDAKLELRGFSQVIAGLDSDADDDHSIVQNQESGTPGPATLTINATTDHVFNGLIRTQAGGALNLIKEGTGTQEIRNIAAQGSNFGDATINAGKLVFNLNTLPGGAGGHNQLGGNVSITVNAGGTLGLDGTWDMNRPVTGAGDVVKQGTGAVTLSSFTTYTGKTNVVGGTLLVTGSISGTSEVNVQNGGTLGGTGTLTPAIGATGNINILEGGKLAPGLGLESGFTVGSLFAALGGGGVFDISLAVTPSNSQSMRFEIDPFFGSDQVILTGGALKIGTGVLGFDDFAFTSLNGFDVGTYKLFDGDTAIVGTLNAANLSGTLAPGLTGTLGFADNGKDLMLTVVPEPGSATLLLASAGSLLGLRRFRRRNA